MVKSSQFVIDIHLKSQPRAFRLLQDTFDFARVFPKEVSATGIQIRSVLKMICKALPQTPVYDQFGIAESLLLADASEKVAVSNALQRRGIGSGMSVEKTTRVEKSAFPVFDLYSTLAHFEALRGRCGS
mgnify:FL=1